MGFFSWITQDTCKSIANQYSNKNTFKVIMADDKGNQWEESNYEGYGEFGGKDYYALLDEMNGGTGDRMRGIDLWFNNDNADVKYPSLSECGAYFSKKPEGCPHQGFFYDFDFPWNDESGDESDDESDEEARKRGIRHSVWSIENTNFDEPLPEDLIAGAKGIVRDSFVNKVVVTFRYNSQGLRLHTWGDLWELCDGIIRTSGDSDHCFIEDITREGDYLMIGCGS